MGRIWTRRRLGDNTKSSSIIPSHVMSSHTKSYHTIPYQVISYRIISYKGQRSKGSDQIRSNRGEYTNTITSKHKHKHKAYIHTSIRWHQKDEKRRYSVEDGNGRMVKDGDQVGRTKVKGGGTSTMQSKACNVNHAM
jgi:hypothetical protein